MNKLTRAGFVVGVVALGTGCGKAFSIPPPASFRDPGAKMAEALRSRAAPPAFRATTAAESLRDVHALEGGRALVDLRRESGDATSYTVLPTCGPLEMWDTTTGQRTWSLERTEGCADQIVGVTPRGITVVGFVKTGEKTSAMSLSTLAIDSGKVIGRVGLENRAFATPSGADAFVTVEGAAAGKQKISLREGDKLTSKWSVALEDPSMVTGVITLGDSVLAFGGSVNAFDRASGKKRSTTSLGAKGTTVADLIPMTDAVFASVRLSANANDRVIAKVVADGSIAWSKPTKGFVDAASPTRVLTVHAEGVTALSAADGSTAWSAKLPAKSTGNGFVDPKSGLWLVPHANGVIAFDPASGAVKFDVAPLGPEVAGDDRYGDHLFAAEDVVVLDTVRGVAGIEIASEAGKTLYAIRVRSLPQVHRDGRIRAALGLKPGAGAPALMAAQQERAASLRTLSDMTGGGMTMASLQTSMAAQDMMTAQGQIKFDELKSSLHTRKQEQGSVAIRQTKLDDESPFVLRPMAWATGNGLLVVRKKDGAFVEVVTGPPSIYEDAYRPSSVAAFVPGPTNTVLTFAEGLDASRWELSTERAPAQLVARKLVGYKIDPASLAPATEYEKRSVVPIGSFEHIR